MPDLDDVRRIALGLPATTESENQWRVGGRGFAWTWKERVDNRGSRVERLDVIAVWVADEDVKQALIADEPRTYFTEAHYNGFRAVLVRLDAVRVDELTELLVYAWRLRAPRGLVKDYDEAHRDKT